MADLDTPLKRLSGIHPSLPWRGLYPLPDGTIEQADRQVIAWLYSGISAGAAPATVAVTGTVTSATEDDIRAGGKTIILTLTDDTWKAAGAAFNAIRQDIIDGLDSASADANGWNAVVRATEPVGSVVRTSNTVVTITLTAHATYDITANETITVTVPSTALATWGSDVTATPTFDITEVGLTGRPRRVRRRVWRSAISINEPTPALVRAEAKIVSEMLLAADADQLLHEIKVLRSAIDVARTAERKRIDGMIKKLTKRHNEIEDEDASILLMQ